MFRFSLIKIMINLSILLLLIVFMNTPQALGSKSSNPLLQTLVLGEDWPFLGKNPQRQSFTLHSILPPLQSKWSMQFEVGQAGVNYVAAQEKLFVASQHSDPMKNLLALDARTGEIIWSQGVAGEIFFQSVAYEKDMNRLYAATDHAIMVYDANGGFLIDEFPFPAQEACGVFGLVVSEGYLYGAICDTITKYDRDGNIIWVYRDPYNDAECGLTPPAMGDSLVYAGSSSYTVHALDPDTGQAVWVAGLPGPPHGGLVYGDGILFVGHRGYLYSDAMRALDAYTGEALWGVRTGIGGSVYASMSYVDGYLYFGALDGIVYAVDTRVPKILWAASAQNDVYGSVVRVGDLVYASNCEGNLFAFDALTGNLIWQDHLDIFYGIVPYGDMLFGASFGRELRAFEALPAIRLRPRSITILPGKQAELHAYVQIGNNLSPTETVQLDFDSTSMLEGITVTITPQKIQSSQLTTVTLTASPTISTFGTSPFTITASSNTYIVSDSIQLFIAQSQLFLPLVMKQ